MQKLLFADPKLFVSQGAVAGGCATHAAAAALTVLGLISDPGRIMAKRAEPNSRRLWIALRDTYAQGISFVELVRRMEELQFPVGIEHSEGKHHDVLRFAVDALQRQRPVILSFAPVNRPRSLHAVLAVGLSGRMDGRSFVPTSLLITDSYEQHPGLGPANARMEFSRAAKRQTDGLYVTAYCQYRVSLDGAISLRRTALPKSTANRP
ncbi:hypothetical protein SAMN04487926_101488 [Paraburkholderia steynii]|uniref:Peptidase C39-like domain-containing protein n=1 Tax=Paraburkholderia steynii TaxID=1245441 RepID=A0A7Z7FEA4_9BURK|nr:hypothetical protein SAMN04487926_101488 [Paraburkholderia steynii]